MRPGWRQRLREFMCRWLGHRETNDDHVIFCSRCRVLLRRKFLNEKEDKMHEHVPPATAAEAAEKAINKLAEMLNDSDPQVRLQAAALLLGHR